MPQAAREPARTGKSGPASTDATKLLKADHKAVSEMFDKFENGRLPPARKQTVAKEICLALTVHAQIEEEIFYPAARKAVKKADKELLDEAEVEHRSIKELVAAIENSPDDPLFEANVKVLGEYVKHHVKEEEGEIFPSLKETDMDMEAIGAQLAERKQELMTKLGGKH